jgi:hypothetical protein
VHYLYYVIYGTYSVQQVAYARKSARKNFYYLLETRFVVVPSVKVNFQQILNNKIKPVRRRGGGRRRGGRRGFRPTSF